MIRYLLHTALGDVSVSIEVDSAAECGAISYEGPDSAVSLVRDWLPYERGVRGYLLSGTTSPWDLAHVMKTEGAKRYEPELLEGADLLSPTEGSP